PDNRCRPSPTLSSPLIAPVVEDVVERAIEVDRGRPPDFVADPRGVAGEHRHVVRTQAQRIDADLDGDLRLGDQPLEYFADGPGLSRGHVVRTARRAPLHDCMIGAYRVADMGRLAPCVEIADDDFGRA